MNLLSLLTFAFGEWQLWDMADYSTVDEEELPDYSIVDEEEELL